MMIRAITNTLNQAYFKGIYGRESEPAKHYSCPKMSEMQNDAFVRTSSLPPVIKPNDISFGYNFQLKKPRGIPCAYCGKETLSTDELYYMQDLKGKKLVDELEKFASQNRSALNPAWRSALYSFERTAQDNPDLNGKDLLPVAYTRARTRMLIKQAQVYSKIERLASVLDSKELTDYINKVKQQDVSLNPDISLEDLSDFLINKIHVEFRKDIVNNVRKIAGYYDKTYTNPVVEKIISTIHSLPSSKNDPDAFLVKYISKAIRKDPKIENELVPLSASSAALFYSNLLFPFASSAEHIKPFSNNGKSRSSNYLVTHVQCNADRGNEPWAEFMLKNTSRFDNVLLNLDVIATNPDIQNSLRRFKVPVYLKQVKGQIREELSDKKDNKYVKSFTEKLMQIGQNNHGEIFNYPDSEIKNSVKEKLNPILSITDSKKQGEAFEKSLKSTFVKYKKDRNARFDRAISHLGNTKLMHTIKNYLIKLKTSDPVLNMSVIDFAELENILSVNFSENYKAEINMDLAQLYKRYAYDEKCKKILKDTARKYVPCKTADSYYIKTLLAARVGENEYDVDKIKLLLEQPTSEILQKRPTPQRIEKLRRMGIANAT